MSSAFVIVPVKRVSEAKSRLSSALSSRDRERLVLTMLEDVLSAVSSSRAVEKAFVISVDPLVLDLAASYGAEPLMEERLGLNEAVQQATEACVRKGAQASLVLPADLPLITQGDIDEVVSLLSASNVVIAPSLDGSGTNALGRRPPHVIPPLFGPSSFRRHMAEALSRSLKVKIVRNERLALDIDGLDDLINLLTKPLTCKAAALLKGIPLTSKA